MVCTGNICRSVMAHQVFAEALEAAGLDVQVEVDSAGVSDEEEGNLIDPRAARVLREKGHAVSAHRARQVRAQECAQWDLILAMTGAHRRALEGLRGRGGAAGARFPEIRLFRDFDPEAGPGDVDLPDPWYGGYSDFLQALEVIERTTPFLLAYVQDKLVSAQRG